MTLTKTKVIEQIMTSNELTRKQSSESVETLLETIKTTLESGEDVLISGFGKFCVKQKAERRGRNPATGKDVRREFKIAYKTWMEKEDILLKDKYASGSGVDDLSLYFGRKRGAIRSRLKKYGLLKKS